MQIHSAILRNKMLKTHKYSLQHDNYLPLLKRTIGVKDHNL